MLNKKILLIFLAAFIIRLIALNQSLWLDEAVTARVVTDHGLTDIVSKFSPTDFHPPLYYLLIKLWTNFFGYSEIALRMPSVLFSLATGYVVYLIAGVWGAIFFLFNPLIVYYSQEARMYMMATFLLTAALYFFISNIKDKISKIHIKNQIFFNLFIFLSSLTFYGSVFLIITFLLYFLYKKQYKNLFICLFVIFVHFLIIRPLLYQQLVNSKIALANVANWSLVLGKANLKNLFLIPIKFSIGRISFYPKWLYWGIAGIWTGFVFFTIKTVLLKTVFNKTVFYLFIFPLFLGFLVSFFAPMLQYFRFIYLIPVMAILLAVSIRSLMYRYIVIIGFLVFSLTYLLLPQFHREDWKSLVRNLPKDTSIYMIFSSSDPVKYYNQNLSIKELRITDYESMEKTITVIPYTADIYGYDYEKNLRKNGYLLNKSTTFRELFFEEWQKP